MTESQFYEILDTIADFYPFFKCDDHKTKSWHDKLITQNFDATMRKLHAYIDNDTSGKEPQVAVLLIKGGSATGYMTMRLARYTQDQNARILNDMIADPETPEMIREGAKQILESGSNVFVEWRPAGPEGKKYVLPVRQVDKYTFEDAEGRLYGFPERD